MTQPFRRIVTGHDADNRAVIVSDAPPKRVYDDLGEPGLVFHEVWHTTETPARVSRDDHEPGGEAKLTLAPPTGGTRIRILDIPPERPDVDFEQVFRSIGGSDAHVGGDAPHPNMHRTRSIDYGIVLDGELTLIVDRGETVVRTGDVVVQRGTNHAWSNRSGRNCRIAFILIDGQFDEGLA